MEKQGGKGNPVASLSVKRVGRREDPPKKEEKRKEG